jgi:hypothetical protein
MAIAVSRMHPPASLITYLEMRRLGSRSLSGTAGWRWSRSALEALELRDLNALYLKLEAITYTDVQHYGGQRPAMA